MKYAKPIVVTTNTKGINPLGSCTSFTCESDEKFSCSNTGFSCRAFKCSGDFKQNT